MTELHEIEKWREEYISLLRNPLTDFELYEFLGFCMAKRSQKVIELPRRGSGYYLDGTVDLDRVTDAIEKAGYKYTIEGE